MRILHVGSYLHGVNDIVNIMQLALRKIPTVQATAMDAQLYTGQPSPFIRTQGWINWIKDEVLREWVTQYLPDVIVCNAGGLSPSPLMHEQLARQGIRRIGIALSDPDDFEVRSSHFAPYFDAFFTNSRATIPHYRALGVNVRHLPFAADPDFHRPLGMSRSYDVVVVGEKRPERAELVQKLRNQGLRVMCYGKDWASPTTEVSGEAQVLAINSGLTYLSFAGTLAGHVNVKVGLFEAAACGSCILVQDFPEIHELFEVDREIVTYTSDDEAVTKALALQAEPDRATLIGQAARERVLKDHTWVERWHRVLDTEYDFWGGERTNAVIQRRTEQKSASMQPTSLLSRKFDAPLRISPMQPDAKSVLIAGYYGFGNTGDEAILTTILDGLRNTYPDLTPIVVSGNPQLTRRTYDVEAVFYLDIEAIIVAAQRCNLIVVGGGGLFMDYWGIDADALLTRFQHGLSFYASFPLLATLLNKPCMVYGVGAGPFFSHDAETITRLVFEQAQVATVRDSGTYQLLTSLGVPETQIQVTADPAFLLQPVEPARSTEILRLEGIPSAPGLTLGVCVRSWNRGIQPEYWWSHVAAALDRFIDTYPAKVVFIPFQTLEEAGIDNDDRIVAQRIHEKMRHSEHAFVIQQKYTPAETLGLIGMCDLLLGMRLHSIIFAALAQIPFVSLAYDPKVSNIVLDLDAQEFNHLLIEVTENSLFEKLELAYMQRATLHQVLATHTPIMQARASENIRMALSLLAEAALSPSTPPPQTIEFIKARFLAQASRLEQQEQQIEYLRNQAASHEHMETKLLRQMETLSEQIDRQMERTYPASQEYAAKLAQVEAERDQIWVRLNNVTSTRVWRLGLAYWRLRDRTKSAVRTIFGLPLTLGRAVYRRTVPMQARLHFKDHRSHLLQRLSSIVSGDSPNTEAAPSPLRAGESLDFQVQQGNKFDVFCFPVIPWDFRFQRPQQLLSQFARDGHRIFYLHTELASGKKVAVRPIQHNIYELSVPGNPQLVLYRDVLQGSALKLAISAIKRFVTEKNIQEALCVVHHPFWQPLANHLKEEYGWKVVYDCMDDHAGFSDNQPATLAFEDQLIDCSDLLVVSSQVLYDKLHSRHPNMLLIRNAGDYDHFSQVVDKIPPAVAALPHPIIGYYGAIAEWFDVEAVTLAAQRHPDWSFVLIGHTFGASLGNLKTLPNVHLLDEQPYTQLPAFLAAMDVCTIPFRRIPLTEATNPVKLYEYLSAGKAVVARRLPETELFKDLVCLYDDAEGFVTGLESMLAAPGAAVIEARKKLAQQNTWRSRYRDLTSSILALYRRASIIMVTFRNAQYTRLALESILDKTLYPNYEVIVVDNGLDPDVLQVLSEMRERNPERIKVKLPGRNLGFAKANNIGIAEAGESEYIVLLNDDVVVTYGWLTGLIRHLRDPQIGMVGPVTNSCGNEARIEVSYSSLEDMDGFARRYVQKHRGQTFSISMLAMYCVGLRKSVADAIGQLDERYGIGMFEDDDYSHRIRQAGYTLACARDVFVHHSGRTSFSKLSSPEYFHIFERNRARYEEKWGQSWPFEMQKPPTSDSQESLVDQLRRIVDTHNAAKGVVIFLPNIGWTTTLFQRPQQTALALARQGYLVFFLLEERYEEGTPGIHKFGERLYLCKCSPLLFAILEKVIAIVYTYNVNLLSSLVLPTVIYEQIDRLEVFSSFPLDQLKQNHELMVKTADVVIGTADRLVEDLRYLRPDALLVPNGVDYEHFVRLPETADIPTDLKVFTGHPIIGYYGALADWLDYELIQFAADHLPEYVFVLIGPDLNETSAPERSFHRVASLKMPGNVHWLGPKEYRELPKYLRAFDVATIPFRVNDVTHAVSPLKLFEYMAGEKPIVTTDLKECAKYEGVLVAKDYADYVSKLQYALTLRDNPEYLATLKRVACGNTWDARAETIVRAVENLRHTEEPR